ncbi:cell wall-active antibiotics response protein [Chitinophaga pendula]|uniref:LiaF transmembrane domain-containing protein n=1 Tax=Chitinophaga TaxID=79328 RepID=UPI000BAF2988|nr:MULTISPECIES: DUF5668 domain-containing protein [Chitinophaga]ASZ14401.1 hypothetical protein CK934_27385 [Chitinophaga sp. MD30]UCJ07946.1 cell wall-active antibiotics response protein [Chitinophaga pendula]
MAYQYNDTDTSDQRIARRRPKRAIGGLILVIVGGFLLIDQLDLNLPSWIVSWQMILIVVGLLVGIKHQFRGGAWLIMMTVGGVFLLREMEIIHFDIFRFIWPAALIGLGIMILLKRDRPHMWRRNYELKDDKDSEDHLDCVAIFGSDNRMILNKRLKGGDLTAVFGGIDLNLTQADFEDTISLNVHAIFGGIELVVPAHWDVKLEVNTIMGGIEDKRFPELIGGTMPTKTLILKGSAIMGGIEIKSYPS